MPSTFFGLNIGYTGLLSANAALNTTGNNIANVETKGYSRQQTVQEAAPAVRTNTAYGMAGAGVNTIRIDQIRNSYYDYKYWSNNADLGIFSVKNQYNRQIEDLFTDTNSTRGFGVVFDDMFKSIDEVYKNSGSDTVKSEFIADCTDFADYFNSMYSNLQKLQADVNNEIQNKVAEINSIAQEIATINKQINMVEITGTKANELRDKRSLLVDQLSTIVDVQVEEVPLKKSESADAEDAGIFKYIVNIANAQNLVTGYEYSTLTCTARDYCANQSDILGLYDVAINEITLNLYGGQLGGELKGLLEMRDGNNGENFSADGNYVDTTGGNTVVVTIDPSNPNYSVLTDINKSTLPNGGKMVLSGRELEYTSWEYDMDAKTYTFHLADGLDATSYNKGDISIGTSLDYQGIPYYMAQMNEYLRSFTQAMNEIEMTAVDGYDNPANQIFTWGSTNAMYADYYEKNADGTYKKDADGNFVKARVISSDKDTYHQMTAESIRVNKEMIADIGKFGTTTDNTKGRDAQDIAELLYTVKTDKDKVSFRGRAAEEFLQCLTADVALNAASAKTFYNNFDQISASIVAQRESEMGVDNDEEALNLVRFREAYNLAAKMISVMTEVYDQLILRTGV